MLRVVAGLDTEVVAEMLGKTPATSGSTAHRGLRRLEAMLRARGRHVAGGCNALTGLWRSGR